MGRNYVNILEGILANILALHFNFEYGGLYKQIAAHVYCILYIP